MTPANTSEKIFVVGATGNVGKCVVKLLTDKQIPTTAFVRNLSKAKELFSDVNSDYLTLVEGDYDSLDTLRKTLPGHTRLFLVVYALVDLYKNKKAIGEVAYSAGIKQIIDLSSLSVNFPWRSKVLGHEHRRAEEALLASAEQHNAHMVTLRPGRFMSNHLTYDRPGHDSFQDIFGPDDIQAWISPNDIAQVAVNIFADPIEKHGDGVYELLGDVVTLNQRADILTRALGRPYIYKQIGVVDKYTLFISRGFPHQALYDLISIYDAPGTKASPGLPILLGRDPETLDQFIRANASAFQ